MPDEALISQIENLLTKVIELGGQNENSQIVPNLTVQDANPAQTGFVIVSDDRDGDNILAKKVGSVIYSNNDLVNVMFLKGAEALAFQQGSQSANSGIWEIVPSTSTDIYYDKGKVGIGTASPATPLDVASTGVVATFGDGSSVAEIAIDGAAASVRDILYRSGGSNRWIIRVDSTAESGSDVGSDFNIQSRTDAGAAKSTVLFVKRSTGFVGIGTTAPQGIIHTYDTIGGSLVWEYDGLDATVRTVVPNGTGDCLYRLQVSYVFRNSAGVVVSGAVGISNGGSSSPAVGTDTVRIRVNADGSIDVARTAGTNTIKVLLHLLWL